MTNNPIKIQNQNIELTIYLHTKQRDMNSNRLSPDVYEEIEYPIIDDFDSYDSSPDINDLSYYYGYIRNPSSYPLNNNHLNNNNNNMNGSRLFSFIDDCSKLDYLWDKIWSFLFYLITTLVLLIIAHSFYIYLFKTR